MLATESLTDLELLVRSRHGIVLMETAEEERALTLLRHLADRLTLPLMLWTRTRGIARDGHANGVYDTKEPAQALAHIVSAQTAALYHFPAFDGLLTNDVIIQRMKDVAEILGSHAGAMVITGENVELHSSVRRHAARFTLPSPTAAEFRELIRNIARDLGRRRPVDIALQPDDEERMVHALRGLTLLEAEKVLTRAMVEDNTLSADDIEHLVEHKKQVVEREGVLEYYPSEATLQEVAGLDGLKTWLRKRTAIVRAPERAAGFGLTFPRGVLLIGVPGCGKSLCARAIASEWRLPLLRLDTGSLYNKFVGETENNFRRAMRVAESVAPCVLFIDELEKAFAVGGTEDGGVSMRVLGTFLSWMQDRQADVFVVATANDVSRLPPEFLRKGRFDETFFVDLPDATAREEILRIHLARRNQDPGAFDLAVVATATPDFSGAELEQVVVAGLYTAFADATALTTQHLLDEAGLTRPLAVTMSEKISSLRAWADGRTVMA